MAWYSGGCAGRSDSGPAWACEVSSAMQFLFLRRQTCQPRTYILERQHLGRRSQFHGSFGHTIYGAGLFVLSDGMMPLIAQHFQAFRAVPAHAGEQDADNIPWPIPGHAAKKDVHARTVRR